MAHRTHVNILDDDSLLQIFRYYRLEDEDDWYLRLSWRKLVHVCRRWRYLMYGESSYMDMCLLFTNGSPSMDPPSHLPHLLPLVIVCSDRTKTMTRNGEDNIHLGIQQHGRVRQVLLRAPSSSLRVWLEPMNEHFPGLRDLSLFSTTTEEMSLVLPELLQAPDLRHLSLHGVGLPRGLSLLSSMISLSTLSLTHIRSSCYFPPGHLVTQLQGLPYLEELSIGFAIPIPQLPLPSSEEKLLPSPTLPVALPTLKRFTFRGEDDYFDNPIARIDTPLLEQLSLTLLYDIAFTLVNLTEFIHRTKGIGCLVARVIHNEDGTSLHTSNYEAQDIGKLSLNVDCKSLDWTIHSAAQVCSALEKVLSSVGELTLYLDVDGMPSDWEITRDDKQWHELLLPFISVKKLRIGSSLKLELSRALESLTEGLVLKLLPKLKELEVLHKIKYEDLEILHKIDLPTDAFSTFMKIRDSVGRPVTVHRIPLFWDNRAYIAFDILYNIRHDCCQPGLPRPSPSLSTYAPRFKPRAYAPTLIRIYGPCGQLSPRHEAERLGGFCSESHKWWLVVNRVPRQTGQGPTDDSFYKDMNEIKIYLQLYTNCYGV